MSPLWPQSVLHQHCALVEELLTALSTIAAPSAGTLTKNVHQFWRVPSLGAAMAESAVSNFDRLSWAGGASLKFSTNARRMRGVFTCRIRRALYARRALRCDLATVLFYTKYLLTINIPKSLIQGLGYNIYLKRKIEDKISSRMNLI